MKRKLYSIEYETDENIYSRDRMVKWYTQIEKSRKPFALAVNSMLDKKQSKKLSLPYQAQELISQLKGWKEEFKRMVTTNGSVSVMLTREYRGQKLSVQFSNIKEKKQALSRIKDSIREIRRRSRISTDPYAMRKPNGMLQEFHSKRLKLPKRPTDGAEYIGIEIECITPEGLDLAPLMPYSKWIEVGGDGSIDHHANESGTEIRVCMRREEVRDVLPGIMQTLKSMGARINKSCGLHVHLDQRNNKEPEKVFQRLVRSLGLLYTVVPESRRRNRYCKRNRHADFMMAVRGDRYKAINASAFHRYHTIEVRLFGGTLEATKIINWIEVLLAIAYGETVMRCPKTFDTALKYWKLSEENLAWLKERQTKFSNLNTGMPVSEHETEANQMLLDETQADEDETCGGCENSLEDCTCNSECDCGDCEECTARQEELDRIARRNRQQADARLELQRMAEVTLPPINVETQQYTMWVGATPSIPPQPITYDTLHGTVDRLVNQQVESMQNRITGDMFTQEYNAEFIGVDDAANYPPVQSPPARPESNNEGSF